MASLIAQVKSRLFIASSRKSQHLLDGAYASLSLGRSLDFEDHREYQVGDEVRDIDWRATARIGTLLVKRSRATRMHTVLFVADTGRGMRALARDERPKRDLVLLAVGALGVLALRHGDGVAVVHGDAARRKRLAPARSEAGLEHALRALSGAIDEAQSANDREELLEYVADTIERRAIVVIVTDEAPVTDDTERLLRRLHVQHDLLWVTVRDADPVLEQASRAARRDVDSGWTVPGFLHGDEAVTAEVRAAREAEDARRTRLLDRLEVSHAELRDQEDAVPALLRMLHRRADVGA